MKNNVPAKAIYIDLDGTLADLYSTPDWLPRLRACDPTPFEEAKPLVHMATLARLIHKKQSEGIKVGIVSWLSKEPDPDYDRAVTEAKLAWLKKHLPSVEFDEIHIIPYGVPKSTVVCVRDGVLFDDQANNREEWNKHGWAFSEVALLQNLSAVH